MAYSIIHGHGNFGPNGKRSYIKLGTRSSKKAALELARREGGKVVAASKLKSIGRGLYYMR